MSTNKNESVVPGAAKQTKIKSNVKVIQPLTPNENNKNKLINVAADLASWIDRYFSKLAFDEKLHYLHYSQKELVVEIMNLVSDENSKTVLNQSQRSILKMCCKKHSEIVDLTNFGTVAQCSDKNLKIIDAEVQKMIDILDGSAALCSNAWCNSFFVKML